MIEEWRSFLYPLGFLPSAFFGVRFIIQWIISERQGKSVVTPIFWKLSLIGNITLAIHTFVQVQYHVCAVQVVSAILSWRNMNLMKEEGRVSFKTVLAFIFLALTLTTAAFMVQGQILYGHFDWVRTPTVPWNDAPVEKFHVAWHILGTAGIFLFASRFWIQWWQAETSQESTLGMSFWCLSVMGALTALIYFIRLNDQVHILGHSMAIIPYIRNMQLIRRINGKES
jgi:lipid-A-disaccharide synthase-like uncharacterized protein